MAPIFTALPRTPARREVVAQTPKRRRQRDRLVPVYINQTMELLLDLDRVLHQAGRAILYISTNLVTLANADRDDFTG
jgi:hypothetical protein